MTTHLSKHEIKDLKERIHATNGNGANIGRANDYLLRLINEVEELRDRVSRPRSLCGVLRVGEMTVKKAPKVEETLTVVEEKVQVTELVANLIEVEVPVLGDFPIVASPQKPEITTVEVPAPADFVVVAPQEPESHSSEPLPETPEVHEEPQEEVRGKGKKKGK